MVTTEHYANHTNVESCEVTDANGKEDEYSNDGMNKWRNEAKNDYD